MSTIAGLFQNEAAADRAIRDLQTAGFKRDSLNVVARNSIVQKVDRAEDLKEGTIQADHKLGPVGGAAVGGLTGLLIGLSAVAIPGIGPALAAGTLATAAAATGMGVAVGGLLGALTSLGITEEDAHFYAEGVKRGGVLVVVEADQVNAPVVVDVMRRAGAVEVDTQRAAWQAEGWTGFDESVLPDRRYPSL